MGCPAKEVWLTRRVQAQDFEVRMVPVPEVGDDEVLVTEVGGRVVLSCVCAERGRAVAVGSQDIESRWARRRL